MPSRAHKIRQELLGALVARATDQPGTEEDKTHADACLHPLRHPFLTETGEYTEYADDTDLFTLHYVARDDTIKITIRYVHPREAADHELFARLADLQRPRSAARATSRCKIRSSGKCPYKTDLLSY